MYKPISLPDFLLVPHLFMEMHQLALLMKVVKLDVCIDKYLLVCG